MLGLALARSGVWLFTAGVHIDSCGCGAPLNGYSRYARSSERIYGDGNTFFDMENKYWHNFIHKEKKPKKKVSSQIASQLIQSNESSF